MRRLITVSYTSLNASGGVPAFNRALHSAFPDRECKHFCWEDFPWHPEVDAQGETEWGKARRLNEYLVRSRLIGTDDVVVADGFWAAGLEHLPKAISVAHGIWSHLTLEDVQAGKQPDMPYHHAAQVEFRRRWCGLGKRMTAVSDFIANEMKRQWGFEVDRVINNGVDTELWKPMTNRLPRARPLVLHGVNDASNLNKGGDHVVLLAKELDADVLSFDDGVDRYRFAGKDFTRPEALAQADIFVHPSGYEGNSMMVAEALACGVPVIGYDVGYLWSIKDCYGSVIDRTKRSPEFTLAAARDLLSNEPLQTRLRGQGRDLATRDLSIVCFRDSWREYIDFVEGRRRDKGSR